MTPEQHANSTAPASAEAPHQISERARLRIQEAYRMIHDFAARSEEEERRNAEQARQRAADDSPIVEGDTSA